MCQQSSYLVLLKHLIFIKKMTLQAIIKDNPHSRVFIFIRTDCNTETHKLPRSVSLLLPKLGCELVVLITCFQALHREGHCGGLSSSPPYTSSSPPHTHTQAEGNQPWSVTLVGFHCEHISSIYNPLHVSLSPCHSQT